MERQVEVVQQVGFVLNLIGVKPPHVSFQIVLPEGTKGILICYTQEHMHEGKEHTPKTYREVNYCTDIMC